MANSIFGTLILGAVMAATPAMSANLCETVGQKYRAVLDTSKPEMPADVVLNLSRAASSGVTMSEPLVENVDDAKLNAWAKAQTPPVSLPADVLAQIADNTDARQDLDRLPGTNFYSVNGTAGTAHCYQPGTYVEIENGKVMWANGPDSWTEEGAGCMVTRYFGAVDGTPVAFQEGQVDGKVNLEITPWNGSGFDAACTASFEFDEAKNLVGVTVK